MNTPHEGLAAANARETLMTDVVAAAVRKCAFRVEPGTLIDVIGSSGRLADAYQEVSTDDSRFTEHDIVRGAKIYIHDAAKQSGALIYAQHQTIPDSYEPDAVESVLQSSLAVVRAFGTVSDEPRMISFGGGSRSNDSLVLEKLLKGRKRLLAFNESEERVHYTDEGRELIRSNARTGEGCPALGMKMEDKAGNKVNLFDAFARDAIPRYVNRFVRPRFHMPYNTKRFLKPKI
jgi:hypothetical protein